MSASEGWWVLNLEKEEREGCGSSMQTNPFLHFWSTLPPAKKAKGLAGVTRSTNAHTESGSGQST